MRVDSHQHFWNTSRGDYHGIAAADALRILRAAELPARNGGGQNLDVPERLA
ncbi:MAG TPA: hypothetical protein VKX45_16825 [Bryobacteraceae bacterium]|nr:hypothetical protein [Bryobacteraceae bacterium]